MIRNGLAHYKIVGCIFVNDLHFHVIGCSIQFVHAWYMEGGPKLVLSAHVTLGVFTSRV